MRRIYYYWKDHIFSFEWFVVFSSILLAFLISSIHIFSQMLQTPAGYTYIGEPHYWEDYFYYLDQFRQAIAGRWTLLNSFTSEVYPPVFLYFWHMLMGHIAAMFHWSPWDAYHIFLFLTKIGFMAISYLPIRLLFPSDKVARMSVLLIFLFSTSFPFVTESIDGVKRVQTARVLRAENLMTSRFGNVPSANFLNIVFVVGFIAVNTILQVIVRAKHEQIPIRVYLLPVVVLSIVSVSLTFTDAAKMMMLLFCMLLGIGLLTRLRINKAQIHILLILVLLVVVPTFFAGLSLLATLQGQPVYENALQWDISEHIRQLTILGETPVYIALALSTLGFFMFIGFPRYIAQMKNTAQLVGLAIGISSIIGFVVPLHLILPIPGFRFLFPSSYIFLAAIAYRGVESIHARIPALSMFVLMGMYLAPNLVSALSRVPERTAPLPLEEKAVSFISPRRMEGYEVLKKLEPASGVVLAPPRLGMDLMIPALTGKTTFSGHPLMTLNAAEKDSFSDKFFYEWNGVALESITKVFAENNIRFIVFTIHDGNVANVKKLYPFLHVAYENAAITIFSHSLF